MQTLKGGVKEISPHFIEGAPLLGTLNQGFPLKEGSKVSN